MKSKNIYTDIKSFNENYNKDNNDSQDYKEIIKRGDINEFKELLDSGFDPSVDNNYAIRVASNSGHLDIVKLLLQISSLDPSVDDNYPIRAAAYNGHTEIVKLLSQHSEVDPSAKDNYSINIASKSNNIEMIKILLKNQRVESTLSKELYDKYSKQIN